MRRLAEQDLGIQDLAVLAEAALGHLLIDPGLLQRVQFTGGRQAFESGDLALHRRNRHDARADRCAIGQHCASTTLAQSAAKLGALQVYVIAEDIE